MQSQYHPKPLQELLSEIKLLPPDWSLVACNANKAPTYRDWVKNDLRYLDFLRATSTGLLEGTETTNGSPLHVDTIKAIGVLCGEPSGGLLFLDHDGASCDGLITRLSGSPLLEALPKTVAVTSGRSGRYQLVYRIPRLYWSGIETKKVRTGTDGDDGKPEQLEFRWNGCQSVVIGYHPQTGGYRWKYHPSDTPIADAPQWMIDQMLRQEREYHRSDAPREEESPTEWALRYLEAIPPSEDYESWLHVGMALHSVSEGLLGEWDKWSSGARNYEPGACDRKWATFKKSGTGLGTLGYLAKQNGWKPPVKERSHTSVKTETSVAEVSAEGLKSAVAKIRGITDPFERVLAENAIGEAFKVRGSRLDALVDYEDRIAIAPRGIGDIAVELFAAIELRMQNPGNPGVCSGFLDVDAMTHGWQAGDLVIVAGRPSMGKTAFAIGCAINAAKAQKTTAIISLEMSSEQLGYRVLASESGISSGKFVCGRINDQEAGRMVEAMTRMGDLPLKICDYGIKTLTSIADVCHRIKSSDSGLDLVVIDYLQLLDSETEGRSGENRTIELSRITRGLKKLAMELNVPVICLSQLSRGVEGRNDKRPLMSDLRDSGGIEQDADIVLMLYRDEYYNVESQDRGIAELIFAKHRNGPTGTVKLLFEPEFTRFRNLRS